jgi:hypothetical protein
MTSGSGALYYSSGANRVTVANYNASGIVTFEVNGGSTALTLNANLSATFASTLSATGATLTGALSGTSASFSSTLTTTGGTRSIQLVSFASDYNYIRSNGAQLVVGTQDSNDLFIQTNNTTRLTFVGSTGAATFASSVTATKVLVNTTDVGSGLFQIAGSGRMIEATYSAASNGNAIRIDQQNAGGSGVSSFALMYLINKGSNPFMTLSNGTSDIFTIQNSGNVGIGTTAPGAVLDVRGSSPQVRIGILSGGYVELSDNQLSAKTSGGIASDLYLNIAGAKTIANRDGGTFLVGTTGAFSPGFTAQANGYLGTTVTSGPNLQMWNQATSGNNEFINFFTEGGGGSFRGSITYNRGAGLVSYNVSSDYRLKTDFKEFNGSDILNKVKVYDYELKETGTRVYGVIAHELAEVLPYAVTGEKDGEKMQGVDYSKIVPVMLQAIKELKAKIETLENK